jgi:hypothetical protein
MSINQIQLSARLVADLYPDTLVETTGNHATAMPEKKAFRYLGSNQKHIAVIVQHPAMPFLPDAELSFLTNILSACKLSLADIAILNFHMMEESWLQEGLEELGAKNVLLFGTEPLSIGLPINFPAFQLQQFNKRTYLHSPGLAEVEKDKVLKQKLWSGLKNMFGI